MTRADVEALAAAVAWVDRTSDWTVLRMLQRVRQGSAFDLAWEAVRAIKSGGRHDWSRSVGASLVAAHAEGLAEDARIATSRRALAVGVANDGAVST